MAASRFQLRIDILKDRQAELEGATAGLDHSASIQALVGEP